MTMLNMGGLPSEFRFYDDVKGGLLFRPLIIADAPAIAFIRDFRRPYDVYCLFSSVLNLTSDQIWNLTVDDCTYILAYLKSICFTDAPITITWDCRNTVVTNKDKRLEFHDDKLDMSDKDLRSLNLHRRSCDRKNTELIYPRQQIITYDEPDWRQPLPPNLAIPTLRDIHILKEAEDDPKWPAYKGFSKELLWSKGDTFAEKLNTLESIGIDVIPLVADVSERYSHGLSISFSLTCFDCTSKPTITNKMTMYDVLPSIDNTSMMNMQYTLMGKMGIVTDEKLPLQKLLYWHSAYLKDKQNRQQAARTGRSKPK